jgi:hypothetical protein
MHDASSKVKEIECHLFDSWRLKILAALDEISFSNRSSCEAVKPDETVPLPLINLEGNAHFNHACAVSLLL